MLWHKEFIKINYEKFSFSSFNKYESRKELVLPKALNSSLNWRKTSERKSNIQNLNVMWSEKSACKQYFLQEIKRHNCFSICLDKQKWWEKECFCVTLAAVTYNK